MMIKRGEGNKRIAENMMRDRDLFDDVSNVPYFTSFLCQQKKPSSVNSRVPLLQSPDHSSSSSSFSNGFCSPEDGEREKWILENMKKDEQLSNDVSNVSYLNLVRQQKLHLDVPQANRVSLPSPERSSFSSVFSNRFCLAEDGSLYNAPLREEAEFHPQYWNGLCLDSKSPHNSYMMDEMGLCQSFRGMNIREDQNGGTKLKRFEVDPDGLNGFGLDEGSLGGNLQYNSKKYGSFGGFSNGAFDIEGFQSSSYNGVPLNSYDDQTFNGLQGDFGNNNYPSMGSSVAHNQSNDLSSGSGLFNNQSDYLLERRKEGREIWSDWGVRSQDPSVARAYHDNPNVFSQLYKMDCNGCRGVMDCSLGASQSMNPKSDLNVYDPLYYKGLMLKETIRAVKNSGFAHSLVSLKGAGDMEALNYEDSLVIQGKGFNRVSNFGDTKNSCSDLSVQNMRRKKINRESSSFHGGSWENDQRLTSCSSLPMIPSVNSLSEVHGNILIMAQDQNGCRWLQRIFDEGTSQDIEMIFNEIIDHVVELMLKPFGNYVIQKFLDVCSEEQRLQIVFMVTEGPGQLVRICLNTYGTRAAQKLIETLKTRQQISLVVSALKPGFLDLVKDQNGNHVIQRCLQCLGNEDNKFIFDAAAKFSVEIATHRHGCCVMQRCITHSTGKYQEKLIHEVSKNSLLLAQDPFGNYVVQYIIELKSPYAVVNLLSQFKKHYVHLSMQKFSSHVVEKCLKHLEESREQIIHELTSVSRFDQLLQDPFANYVIQSALAVTKGPLRSLLVETIRPLVYLRTNPYSKRIFSRNALKK